MVKSGGEMDLMMSEDEANDSYSDSINGTSYFVGSYEDPYLSSPIKPILIATYVPIFMMAMIGNLLVIFVIARNRSMQTVTNFFLANLAVADLLVALCCVIPKLLWFIMETWTLGAFMCRMHSTMISLTTNASIFILTIISAERFIAIVYPFETKQILTSKRLFVAVVGVWCLSAVLSLPTALFHTLVVYKDNMYCGSSSSATERAVRIHTLVMFNICFAAPLIIMSILYLVISYRLWYRNREGKLGMVSRNNYTYTRRSSVDAVLEKADIASAIRATDSPVRCHVNKAPKAPSMDEVSSFIPKNNDETSDYASDHNVETCTSVNGDDYCVKVGPFFLDEPEEEHGPIQSMMMADPDHKWNLCKDPPMGLTKIDLKQVKFGFEGGENKKGVRRLQSQQSEDSIDSLPGKQNGRFTQGHSDLITECDKITNTGRYVIQSPRIKVTQAQSTFDSPHYSRSDRDSPILSVSGNTTSTSISNKINRRKKQRNAKAVMIARRKVIRLLIIMLVAFALCLFPIQLLAFWSHYGYFPQHTIAGTLFIPFAYAAYFFNSALNPFLYAFLSDNFRSKMRETLCIPTTKSRGIPQRHKKIRNQPSGAYTESDWTHSLHLTTDASLHQI